VPWGFTNPPAVSPVLEAPGGFHPPVPRRRLITMDGRASPRLYAFGLIAGLPGIAALLLILVGLGSGFKLPGGAIPRWLILEAACVVAAAGLVGWAVAQGRQRRADGWRDYAGPSPFLMIGALLAIVTAFQIPLEAALDSAKVDFDSGLATALLVGMFLATYASLVHFLVVRPGSLTWHDIARPRRLAPSTDDWATGDPIPGWSRRAGETVAAWRLRISSGRIGDLLMPVAMVLPLVIASTLLSAGMLLVLGLKASDISTPGSSGPLSEFDRILLFVAVAILAPVGEEIFFRGFATNAWGRSRGRASTIVRSSLFFAFIHVMNTSAPDPAMFWRVALFNFGARIPVAFVLTWLYMRRRSILASGMLHAGYNGLITLMSLG
jgi:membrane protease YdiL (CAAX protease family)